MDAIYTRGWVIVDDFLTAAEVDALKACLPGEWQPAGIGRDALHQGNPDIRRDQIHWLEPSLGAPVADYLARMESLRLAANRMLMLGLFDYEAHFARYRSGDFYATHRDAFAGRSNRRLTTVFYLNNDWLPEAGGVLRMYDDQEQFLMDVSPKGGRLVMFLSEEFPTRCCLPIRSATALPAGFGSMATAWEGSIPRAEGQCVPILTQGRLFTARSGVMGLPSADKG